MIVLFIKPLSVLWANIYFINATNSYTCIKLRTFILKANQCSVIFFCNAKKCKYFRYCKKCKGTVFVILSGCPILISTFLNSLMANSTTCFTSEINSVQLAVLSSHYTLAYTVQFSGDLNTILKMNTRITFSLMIGQWLCRVPL